MSVRITFVVDTRKNKKYDKNNKNNNNNNQLNRSIINQETIFNDSFDDEEDSEDDFILQKSTTPDSGINNDNDKTIDVSPIKDTSQNNSNKPSSVNDKSNQQISEINIFLEYTVAVIHKDLLLLLYNELLKRTCVNINLVL